EQEVPARGGGDRGTCGVEPGDARPLRVRLERVGARVPAVLGEPLHAVGGEVPEGLDGPARPLDPEQIDARRLAESEVDASGAVLDEVGRARGHLADERRAAAD